MNVNQHQKKKRAISKEFILKMVKEVKVCGLTQTKLANSKRASGEYAVVKG